MRLWPKSLKWRTILLTLFGLLSVLVSVGVFCGRDIYRAVRQHAGNFELRDDPDPIVRALARGEIHSGSDIEEVKAKYPPKHETRIAEFVQFEYPGPQGYQHGPHIIAVNGRLAFARQSEYRSYCPSHEFFDTLTEQEAARYCQLWGRVHP